MAALDVSVVQVMAQRAVTKGTSLFPRSHELTVGRLPGKAAAARSFAAAPVGPWRLVCRPAASAVRRTRAAAAAPEALCSRRSPCCPTSCRGGEGSTRSRGNRAGVRRAGAGAAPRPSGGITSDGVGSPPSTTLSQSAVSVGGDDAVALVESIDGVASRQKHQGVPRRRQAAASSIRPTVKLVRPLGRVQRPVPDGGLRRAGQPPKKSYPFVRDLPTIRSVPRPTVAP